MKVLRKFKKISTFIFDIDGVMTSGRLQAHGADFVRQFSLKDGFAIRQAIKAGYNVVIISGAHSPGIVARLDHLGIKDYFLSISDKLSVYQSYIEEHKLNPEEILFMGDDLPDLPLMKEVALACCPKDATPELVAHCEYISPRNGGEECVRDVIEKVMRLHGKWVIG